MIFEAIAQYLSRESGLQITHSARFHPDFVEFSVLSNITAGNEILLFSILSNENSNLAKFHDENLVLSNPNLLETCLNRTNKRIEEIKKTQDRHSHYKVK